MRIVIIILLFLLVLLFLVSKNYFIHTPDENISNLVINYYYPKFSQNRFKMVPGTKNLNYVDMVYAIYMPQRLKYISTQINKLGVSCTYFNAITPNDLTMEDYDLLSIVHNPLSRIYKKYTRLCVLLSFVMCFIHALEHGYSTIAIFEDDMKILTNESQLQQGLEDFHTSDCDLFYMGYCFLQCGQPVRKMNTLIEIADKDLLCCHSMCIKTKVLSGLIKYCFPMRTNSDELFRDYYIRNNIKVCVPKTVYFTQNRKDLGSLNQSIPDPELFQTCVFK